MDKTPVQMLADQLAEMTLRCIKAEQERDEQKERADRWYESWQKTDEDLRATRLKLTNALADQHELREKCHRFIAEHTSGEERAQYVVASVPRANQRQQHTCSEERTQFVFPGPKQKEGEADA